MIASKTEITEKNHEVLINEGIEKLQIYRRKIEKRNRNDNGKRRIMESYREESRRSLLMQEKQNED